MDSLTKTGEVFKEYIGLVEEERLYMLSEINPEGKFIGGIDDLEKKYTSSIEQHWNKYKNN